MKSIVTSFALASFVLAGCTAEVSPEAAGFTEDPARVVRGALRFRSPGAFDLSLTPGDTVPETGCNIFTSLRLENAPLATAKLKTEVGPNRLGQICAIAAVFDERVYAIAHAVVDSCGVKTFRGGVASQASPGSGGQGPWTNVTIIDRRESVCPVATVYPPPAAIEVHESAGGAITERFSRLPSPPAAPDDAFHERLFRFLPGDAQSSGVGGGGIVLHKVGDVSCVMSSVAPPGGPVQQTKACSNGVDGELSGTDAEALIAWITSPPVTGGGGGVFVRREASVTCTQTSIAALRLHPGAAVSARHSSSLARKAARARARRVTPWAPPRTRNASAPPART